MYSEKVIYGFFIILACTLNFGFFAGEVSRPELHHPAELFAAVVVNLIALVLKFGDRTQAGAVHLGTQLAACLQLLAAALYWTWSTHVSKAPANDIAAVATVVSLSGGALLANLVSVVLLVGETLRQNR